jgi:membrane-associated phospholipid phosphatase
MTLMDDPLNRRLMLWGLATIPAVATLMIWVDVPLALYFNGYRDTWWAEFFNFITDFANGAIWYPVAVLGIGFAWLRHKKRLPNPARFTQELRAWLFMIAVMASSGTFVNAVKVAVGRERPRLLFRDGTTGFHPFNLNLTDCGFPSGHTQSIWTAMLCLGFLFPRLRFVFFTVAVFISASRIIIGAHYAGDVTASLYIAFFATLVWKRWFEKDGMSVRIA